ncbi:MAG: hypothetical protein FD166_1464 [Bacteroidetes bacterium]|nr:MAG: hypothetical protein FD166_1464 [Bacteroidota bacterium]
MNVTSQLSLLRQGRRSKLAANPFPKHEISLLDVLIFVSTASHVALRAIRIAILSRRRELIYTVTLKNGHREIWAVDSPDQMIDILIHERRKIIHVTKGKEAIV